MIHWYQKFTFCNVFSFKKLFTCKSHISVDISVDSTNIYEALLINPSANVLVFGDFSNHHKDWLISSGVTDWPGEFCYNFLSQMTLLRWLTFILRFHTVIFIVLRIWISIFLLRWVFVLQSLSLHLEILIENLSVFLKRSVIQQLCTFCTEKSRKKVGSST